MLAVLDFTDYGVITIIVILFSGATAVYLKPRDKRHLARLEKKIDLLLQHFGIENAPTSALPQASAEALRSGDKIAAIKHFREATGVGLKEAKDAVEDAQSRGDF